MTFSPLISGTVPHSGKYSSRQGRPVSKVVQHHWAGTGGGIERMSGPDQASTTYLILTDGRVLGHVPEEFRPWTSGSFEADGDAITIEVQNTSGQVNGNDSDSSSWRVSDAAYNSIIALLADVAHRYGWGGINSSNYRGHREFSSTACPGGYLWSRMGNTRAAAQALFSGGSFAAQGGTTNQEEEDMPNTPLELEQAALNVITKNPTVIGGRSLVQGVNQALLGIDVVNENIAQLKTFIAQQIAPDAEVKGKDTTYYLKGDKKPEVYALNIATGKLRHVLNAEFDVVRAISLYKEVEQAKVDALLKAGA